MNYVYFAFIKPIIQLGLKVYLKFSSKISKMLKSILFLLYRNIKNHVIWEERLTLPRSTPNTSLNMLP